MALFLITGASGSGKTSVSKIVESRRYWKECVSHTTRNIRIGEEDGKTYYFVSKEEFESSIKNNSFVEHVEYDGNLYGMSNDEIGEVLKDNTHAYIIVEYDGYLQIKEKYPDAIGIFLYSSKEDCMANMLIRGDSFESALARISTYDDEVKNKHNFDYVIKNVRERKINTANILAGIVEQHS